MQTRRSFMTSMAAAFALPSLSIADNIYDSNIDLNPWLCHLETRFDLSKPWDVAGRSVATDGCKLIRVGLLEGINGGGNRDVPQFNNLPWEAFESDRWKRLPDGVMGGCEDVSCCECLGIGWIGNTRWCTFSVRDAPQAYRKSWMEENEYYEVFDNDSSLTTWLNAIPERWNHTGWHGDQICQRCNGTGWLDHDGEVYLVEGVPYEAGYINAAKKFGEIEYRQEDYDRRGGTSCKLMLFRGDGFNGMIMPRRKSR